MTENVNFTILLRVIGISVTANLSILIVIRVIASPLSVISVIVSVLRGVSRRRPRSYTRSTILLRSSTVNFLAARFTFAVSLGWT